MDQSTTYKHGSMRGKEKFCEYLDERVLDYIRLW